MPFPLCLLGSLAAEIFLLELLEVFLSEHSALSLLLLLRLGYRPVTGLAASVLAHDLGMGCVSGSLGGIFWHMRDCPLGLHNLADLTKCYPLTAPSRCPGRQGIPFPRTEEQTEAHKGHRGVRPGPASQQPCSALRLPEGWPNLCA